MRFWTVAAYDKAGQKEIMILQCSYEKERIIEILAEVHPEFERFELKEIDRPKWVQSSWGDEHAA